MSTRPEHDVIIVGASIAGCRTALTLSDAGARVLLLDRARFPRWKPCAGGLTVKTRPYLAEPLWDLVEGTMRGGYLTLGEGYETHVQADGPLGWMVHRESFDEAHLALAASRPTVEVALDLTVRGVREDGDRVRVETDRGKLEARVVVGADGAKSVVSRTLPGHEERRMGFAYEGEARPADPRLTEDILFDFRTFPHGYGWIFPKRDHYSLGGYVYRQQLPAVKRLYEEFCTESTYLQEAETYRARGHPIALGGSLRRLNRRRIVLAGEAADLVDPLTGEGIYYALRSGELAGQAVAGFLHHGHSLDAYGRQVRREIQEHLRWGRILADFIYRHPRLAYHLLFRNALICQWFVEIGAGTKRYDEVVREAVLRGPLLPFHGGRNRREKVRVQVGPHLSPVGSSPGRAPRRPTGTAPGGIGASG